ncbi:MAG: GHKL domain-containing protein [Bacteroidales bacterium]|nr:GHKL domain-containing protein [Bacteroidales bacterium]
MGFKHFYTAIFFRLIIIISFAIGGTYLFFEQQAYILCGIIFLLLIATIINIIRYFNNTNQWISFFLLGIENEDATLKAPKKTGNKTIDEVYKGMERLNELFKQTKIDINTQEQYFRSIINQSATGLFSVNEKGRVINSNPAAIKLTKLQDYHHVNILNAISDSLPGFIMDANPSLLSAVFENQYGQKLLFKLSEIKTHKEIIKLVAVSDITKEIDTREVDAWIKLARTLSHEIMNNIAPITTLSQVISGYFVRDNQTVDLEQLKKETIVKTVKGLNVIEKQSLGLMNFVENYRKFTKLPEPQLKEVNLCHLIEENLIVAETFIGNHAITLEKSIGPDISIQTDEILLSQVLINLMKNAIEALIETHTQNPKLSVKLLRNDDAFHIAVSNNGPNILPEIREQIFIPFYTTKETGSGIGLSLSKQIMLKMNGDVLLSSPKDDLTTFVIVVN